MVGRSPSWSARFVVSAGKSDVTSVAVLLAPATLPMTFSRLLALRDATPYVILNPARNVVFSLPNQGSCHANPMAGPMLPQSFRTTLLSGLSESGPTYSSCVILAGSQFGVGSRGFCAATVLEHCSAFAALTFGP